MSEDNRAKSKADKERWLKGPYGKTVAKAKERRARFDTASGIPQEPVYVRADVKEGLPERLGLPGEYPFTRGVQTTMYRGRFWTMRQYAGFGSAAESNERYKYLLKSGQTGLSVAFDLPTQMGRDSDHPRAKGEVGKVGVAIDSIEDMGTLLDGIPREALSIDAGHLASFAADAVRKSDAPPRVKRGALQGERIWAGT